jgi:ORF6N domain
LAELYGVETRVLVQAVKRNPARFPDDFMFQLSPQEFAALRSQTVISNNRWRGGRRTPPYAFTEQGVAMLSTVLGSARAIAINIEIMGTFVRVRAPAVTHGGLAKRLAELEQATEALDHESRHAEPQHARAIQAGVRRAAPTHDAARSAEATHRVRAS